MERVIAECNCTYNGVFLVLMLECNAHNEGLCIGISISQPDVPRTIEGVLFDALVRTGAVSQDNASDPGKVLIPKRC